MTPGNKTSASRPGEEREFLNKAYEFAQSMDDALAKDQWSSAALLGVHSAISAADAITSKYLGRHSSSQRHDDAASLLETLPVSSARERAGLLREILSAKQAAAYEGRRFAEKDASVLAKRVHRFIEWVRKQVPE